MTTVSKTRGKVKEQKAKTSTKARKHKVLSVRQLAEDLGLAPSIVYYHLSKSIGWSRRVMEHPVIRVFHNGYGSSLLKAIVVLRRSGLRFYTFPPNGAPWPWILVNVYGLDGLEKYLEVLGGVGLRVEHVLLDVGVEKYWKKPYNKLSFDYDGRYWDKLLEAISRLRGLARRYGFNYMVTIPDYPDDYVSTWKKSHALWVDEYTNIDRTIENIVYVIDHYREIPWLPVAQGYWETPESIVYSIEQLISLGVLDRFRRIALGNLCTTKNAKMIAETIVLARRTLRELDRPNTHVHVFGPGLSGVKKALNHLVPGSWDSTAWTFPRGAHLWSCKNSEERLMYFLFYLKHIYEVLS